MVSVWKTESKVSIVPLRRNDDWETKTEIGFSFHQYELEKDTVIENMTTEDLKIHTSDYCVMLPFVVLKKENFRNKLLWCLAITM